MNADASDLPPLPPPVFVDAIGVLIQVMHLSERIDEGTESRVEAYLAESDLMSQLWTDYGADRPVPREAVLYMILLCCSSWFDGGAEQLAWLPSDPPLEFADDEAPHLDQMVLACLTELAIVHAAQEAGARRNLVNCLLTLHQLLEDESRWRECEQVAAVAYNVAPDPELRQAASRVGAESAARAGSRDRVAFHVAVQALAAVDLAAADPRDAGLRAQAAEALFTALRHVRELESQRTKVVGALRGAVQQLREPIIGVLLALAVQPDVQAGDPDGERAFAARVGSLYTMPIWDLDSDELARFLPGIVSMAAPLENLVLRPQPTKPQEIQLEARWTTAAFDHPSYRQAVPYARTLFREGDIATILFELAHEVTHVVCMQGGIGAAMTALRAAAVQLESTLWHHVPAARHDEAATSLVAPLEDADVLALGQAEQALEAVRCMRLLERVWTAWLEGVAVFNELASDPSGDDQSSLVSTVLANLIDTGVPSGVDEGDAIADLLTGSRAETDALFTSVLASAGSARLRAYLGPYWPKYGPGYLAVRAVVSSWRRSLDRPLTGTEAARVVLHLTRYGSLEAIPDLGLGSTRFGPAALKGMTGWVRSIAAMSRDDLEYVLTPGVNWGWRDGRVLRADEFGPDHIADSARRFTELAMSAWQVHRGDRSDPGRVGEVPPDTMSIMAAVAQALALATHHDDLALSVGRSLDDQTRVLPIGTLLTTWWLNPPTRTLVVVLRTTLADKDHGNPGYSLQTVPLTQEQVDDLASQMHLRPNDRMRVTRLADLTPTEFGPDRYAGRNVLAFSLGDWLHVHNAGPFLSLPHVPPDLVAEVGARLTPPLARVLETEVCEGRAAADRTISWIDQAWGSPADRYDTAVSPWVDYVRTLAVQVRDRDDEAELEQASAAALLAEVLGEFADELVRDGVSALTYGEAPRMSKLVELLFTSAREPVPSDWLDSQDPDDEFHHVFINEGRGWDVRPTTKEKT